jgi:hypothetical protein
MHGGGSPLQEMAVYGPHRRRTFLMNDTGAESLREKKSCRELDARFRSNCLFRNSANIALPYFAAAFASFAHAR